MSIVTFFYVFFLCLGILVGFLIANLVIETATRKNKRERTVILKEPCIDQGQDSCQIKIWTEQQKSNHHQSLIKNQSS